MKTKLMNFRVEEPVHAKIKRAAAAVHESVTDFLLASAAMRMRALAAQPQVSDPLDQAFEELFRSGKVAPLTASERSLLRSYEARKAKGDLQTLSAGKVLEGIDKELGRKAKAG